MKHVKKFEDLSIPAEQSKQLEPRTSNITSSELWRDRNAELKQLLNNIANLYKISREDASKALAQYFSSEHWKAGEK